MSTRAPVAGIPVDLVVVGRILRPHGLRGEVSVASESDVGRRFDVGRALLVQELGRRLIVADMRFHHQRLLLRFEGVEDRDAAQALCGLTLAVERREVPPPPAGTYYHFELVGCVVEDLGVGELGVVEAVLEDGGGFLLQIAASDRRLLVPFVHAVLRLVELEERRIVVDLPLGLVEACTSMS